jgi:hypothetical protein
MILFIMGQQTLLSSTTNKKNAGGCCTQTEGLPSMIPLWLGCMEQGLALQKAGMASTGSIRIQLPLITIQTMAILSGHPDVVEHKGIYHMYLTYVPGTFTDWNHPREIVHLTSKDLTNWKFESVLDLASHKIIDASVIKNIRHILGHVLQQ